MRSTRGKGSKQAGSIFLLILVSATSYAWARDPLEKKASALTDSPSGNRTDMLVHEREFVSPLVRVQMDCQRDKTLVRVNFSKPYNGILSVGRIETTKCKLFGDGSKQYEISVNHNATECEAQWDVAHNSITNTLYVRFHSSLETGSDIAKNIMCRLAVGDLVVGKRPSKSGTQRQQQQQQSRSNTR